MRELGKARIGGEKRVRRLLRWRLGQNLIDRRAGDARRIDAEGGEREVEHL